MPIPAHPYLRYSSKKQESGDSTRRQGDATKKFILQHGWEYKPLIKDDGVSASTGENIESGELGEWLRDVDSGAVATPCVIVTEKLDRLTRLNLEDSIPLVMKLLKSGVSIATTMNERILRPEDANSMFKIMEVMMELSAAYDYTASMKKRVKESWSQKKLNAANGLRHKDSHLISPTVPFWISVKKPNGTPPSCFKVHAGNKKIVKRIFKEYQKGKSICAIAKGLNDDGIGPPSEIRAQGGFSSDKRVGGGTRVWCDATVKNTLKNVNVIGCYQPKQKAGKNSTKKDGGEVANYYPPIITLEEFQTVQGLIDIRNGVKGRKSENINNLFSGLFVCKKCGWNCSQQSATSKNNKGYYWLTLCCKGAKEKKTFCEKININSYHLEAGIITAFQKDLFVIIYKPEQSKSLKAAKAELLQLEKNYDSLHAQITERTSKAMAVEQYFFDAMSDIEKDRVAAKAKVDAIPALTEWDYPEERINTGEISPLIKNIENRARIRDIFRTLINKIEVDFESKTLWITTTFSEHYTLEDAGGQSGRKLKLGPRVIQFAYDEMNRDAEINGKPSPSLYINRFAGDEDDPDLHHTEYCDEMLWIPAGQEGPSTGRSLP
jgi:DNA invertase Pin-like site-specific DNA recombinase